MAADKLSGIEAGRGIAALLVVAVHARGHLLKAFGPSPFADILTFAHIGVDFFFVLSGFIILHVHAADIGRPAGLGRYLQRRFTRIFPLYWAVLAAFLLLPAIKHSLPPVDDLLSAALLLPFVESPVPVAWSLQHEVVFYAAFALLIINRYAGIVLLGGWLALIVRGLLTPGDDPSPGALLNMHSHFDAEFFFGMFAAALLRRTRIPCPRVLLLVGAVVFFGLGAAENLELVVGQAGSTHLGYGFASMLMVLGAVEAERQGRLRAPRLLVALGGASYTLYLTHLLTIGAVWQVLLATGLAETTPQWLQFIVFVAASVAVGVVGSRTLEAWLIGLTRRFLAFASNRLTLRYVRSPPAARPAQPRTWRA